MLTIILDQPQQPENIGFVARCMKNFGYCDLIISDPFCDQHDEQALRTAMHAKDVLLTAKIVASLSDVLMDFDKVLGTTAMLGKDTNLLRTPVDIKEIKQRLPEKTAVVFGNEAQGLSNEQLKLCDLMITLPTAKQYPTMNLSHAVAVVLYELNRNGDERISHIKLASREDHDRIAALFSEVIEGMDFATPDKKETQKLAWGNIIHRSSLTKREAMAVYGFLRKLLD